ncbi:MAG: glycoside hydrolase family 2 [Lachnospiraceae bacterium]|nr:glycoside hydrolase family 2 [Lachnospiraceae bacterium]
MDLNSWNIYPRPQMVRKSFLNLNGSWDFCEGGENIPSSFDEKITVPFAMESDLSGIGRRHDSKKYMWYRTFFDYKRDSAFSHVLLNCGGIDQTADVFLNGIRQNCPLDFIHDNIRLSSIKDGRNELLIRVYDDIKDLAYPYGKQSNKPSGMWYTPVSGIWQTVWIEEVPLEYVTGLKIIQRKHGVDIRIFGAGQGVVTLKNGDKYHVNDGLCRIRLKNIRYWSAKDPYLYEFTLRTGEDEISSYFGIRSESLKEAGGRKRLCINDHPVFFHGLLDQGYFKDGIYTPDAPVRYAGDIKLAKDLGFNMLRKHIKVEPEVFYYLCDKLGMYVFQDMVNNGDYAFLRDTIIPTFGFQWLPDHNTHKDRRTRKMFCLYAQKTVKRLYNHPSIVYWTIFNEGWGQFQSTYLYKKLKKWDPGRFADSNSGWFKCGKSDISSWHVYFHKFFFPVTPESFERAVVLSEFGGYAYKVKGHTHNENKLYGYAKFKSLKEYNKALEALYDRDVIAHIPGGLSGAVYTQLSDVETEENGICTYDRQVVKPDRSVMLRIKDKIDEAMKTIEW